MVKYIKKPNYKLKKSKSNFSCINFGYVKQTLSIDRLSDL